MSKKQDKKELISYKLSDFLTPKIWIKDNILYYGSTIEVRDLRSVLNIDERSIAKILGQKRIENNHILTSDEVGEIAHARGIDFKHLVTINELNVLNNINRLVKQSEFYKNSDVRNRPPIITIMGHVDHGKTTLLDFIKKSNVASTEAGGITQRIGAYTITHQDKEITFIDTPGHEAFTKMRAHGSQVTDIAIIVVAADDSIMPQTKESIDHAKAAGVPIIVAINKVDKPNIDLERVYNEVSSYGLQPEEWGGDTPFVKVSAVSGQGVDELLETILLQAELLDLKASYNIIANGVVIESNIDSKKGFLVSVIINDGILKSGDYILIQNQLVKIKAIYDATNNQLMELSPSQSAELFGLGFSPASGTKFSVISDLKDAKKIISEVENFQKLNASNPKALNLSELFLNLDQDHKNVEIVLKAKSFGSLQAIKDQLEKIQKPYGKVKVIRADTGDVTNSDVTLAEASNAHIFTFELSSKNPVPSSIVKVNNFNIIYELIEAVNNVVDGYKKAEFELKEIGQIKVIRLFESSKFGKIIGGSVATGKITNNSIVKIFNNREDEIFSTLVKTLKIEKNTVKEVPKGKEFGVVFDNMNFDFRPDQIIKIYIEVEKSE